MRSPASGKIRRAVRLANANAALWAFGAGLAPTLLIAYLAMGSGGGGLTMSLVLAAPRFAGVLRLATPTLVRWLGSSKRVCVAAYLLSSLLLASAVTIPSSDALASPHRRLAALVIAWAAYQVTEYVGTTSLWAWLGQVYPQELRGRLIGRREQWLTRGQIGGALLGFAITSPSWLLPDATRQTSLAIAGLAGAAAMATAVLPLLLMPPGGRRSVEPTPATRPLAGDAFTADLGRVLVWSMLLSFANGIAAPARGVMSYQALGLTYPSLLVLTSLMRLGQSLVAPALGSYADRHGCRRLIAFSQAAVSASPLFFLLATPDHPWWVACAYACWVAYAGLNVGLDLLKLQVAPPGREAGSLAIYYAANDLASGVTIVAGGVLLASLIGSAPSNPSAYAPALLLGFAARLLVGSLAHTLPPPPAKRGKNR